MLFRNAGIRLAIGLNTQDKVRDFLHRHFAGAQQGATVPGQIKVQADVIPAAQLMRDQFVGFAPGQFRSADNVSPATDVPG